MDLEPVCWLQCPKCKKQSKFKLRDIVRGVQAKCRLCQTPIEVRQEGLAETRQNLKSMLGELAKKGLPDNQV